MEWVLWMIAVGVLGLAAVAASGRLGELPGTVTDTPRPHVPTGAVSGDDLRALRFAVVPRGYSMDQVDGLLDRLARQLDAAPVAQPTPNAPAVDGPMVDGPADDGPADDGPAADGAAVNPRGAAAATRVDAEASAPAAEDDPARPPGSGSDPSAQTSAVSDDERPAFFRPAGEGQGRLPGNDHRVLE